MSDASTRDAKRGGGAAEPSTSSGERHCGGSARDDDVARSPREISSMLKPRAPTSTMSSGRGEPSKSRRGRRRRRAGGAAGDLAALAAAAARVGGCASSSARWVARWRLCGRRETAAGAADAGAVSRLSEAVDSRRWARSCGARTNWTRRWERAVAAARAASSARTPPRRRRRRRSPRRVGEGGGVGRRPRARRAAAGGGGRSARAGERSARARDLRCDARWMLEFMWAAPSRSTARTASTTTARRADRLRHGAEGNGRAPTPPDRRARNASSTPSTPMRWPPAAAAAACPSGCRRSTSSAATRLGRPPARAILDSRRCRRRRGPSPPGRPRSREHSFAD